MPAPSAAGSSIPPCPGFPRARQPRGASWDLQCGGRGGSPPPSPASRAWHRTPRCQGAWRSGVFFWKPHFCRYFSIILRVSIPSLTDWGGGETLPGCAPPHSQQWARSRRQKGRSAPPPFCGESAGPAAVRSPLQSRPEEPPPAAAMLSARLAAALARSLPRQAGLVSVHSPPYRGRGGGGRGAAAILAAAVTLRGRGLPLWGAWGGGVRVCAGVASAPGASGARPPAEGRGCPHLRGRGVWGLALPAFASGSCQVTAGVRVWAARLCRGVFFSLWLWGRRGSRSRPVSLVKVNGREACPGVQRDGVDAVQGTVLGRHDYSNL